MFLCVSVGSILYLYLYLCLYCLVIMFLCVSTGSSLRRFGQSIKRIVREVEQQESGGDDDDGDGGEGGSSGNDDDDGVDNTDEWTFHLLYRDENVETQNA